MAGTNNASKASSKLAASDGQQSLLHFYKKKPKPLDEVAKAAETLSTETVSPAHNVVTPLSPEGGRVMSSLLSVEIEIEQQTLSNESISSKVDDSTAPQGSHGLRTIAHPHTNQSEPTVDAQDDPEMKEIPRRHMPSDLESDLLRQPIVVDSSSSPPEGREVNVSAKLPREPYPIFKRRRPPPSSPPSSIGNIKRPPNQQASSSKLSHLDIQGKAEVKKIVVRDTVHDVVDLTVPSHHDEPVESGRAASANSSDPIIVIDDEPDPRGSKDAPIVLTFSPPPNAQRTKVVHPFFARRAATQKGDDPAPSRSTTSLQMQTLWPDAEMQHTRGPQSCFWSSSPSPFAVYRRPAPPAWFSSQPSLKFLQNRSDTPPLFSGSRACGVKSHMYTPVEREEIISKSPASHREHSGISRLLGVEFEPLRAAEDGEAWTHKWRPRRAAEVLGNDDNLRYMKEWLQALEIRTGQMSKESPDSSSRSAAPMGVRGMKRPIVVRAVEKKRGRKRRRVESDDGSSLGDWIVQDEEEEEPISEFPSEDDLLLDRSSPGSGRVSASSSKIQVVDEAEDAKLPTDHDDQGPIEFAHLTNTILLAGPSGSGKTSAVHACAEELGWEIFEVYPGIGRRSGANISSLVGDVGKNHLVGRREASGSNAKGASVQKSFITSGFGFFAEDDHKNASGHEDANRAVRQSIILLEEVDVLFKEDANFWPAVVNIIKSSHRPVFMTCNDLSLVPRDDLPLQATLLFQPCPPALAISFLQAVCLAEGKQIPPEYLNSVYATTYEPIGPDQPDEPQVPFPSQPQACSDLRHALNELQFWCRGDGNVSNADTKVDRDTGTSLITTGPSSEVLADWSRAPERLDGGSPEEGTSQGFNIFLMWKHSEYVSNLDAYLDRRSSDVLEALAIDRYGPSSDDEIGHALLEKPNVVDYSNSLSFYNWDEEIARETLATSRHVYETSGTGPRVRSCLLGNERGATFESRSLLRDRAANQMQLVAYLDDVIPLSAPLLPRAPAVLEYAAYIRQMVSADDAMEKAANESSAVRSKRGRETRSRWRYEDCRYLALSAEGLEGARRTRLELVMS